MAPYQVPKVQYTQLFINNEWRDAVSGKTFPTINPATGEKIVDVAEADKEDVDIAVKAAREAFKRGSTWRRMDASQRGRLLSCLGDLMEQNLDYIASLETLDNGKPINAALYEIKFVVNIVRYYAGFADKIHGKVIPSDGEVMCYTRMEPLGVCAAILPWNVPMIMWAYKLAPALAAGNTIVIKPAEQTPLTALYCASLVKEAGFPAGVVNIVPGFGATAGNALSSHMDVDKVGFTGSTAIGQRIQQAAAASNLKHVTLELGGKSPLVFFDDCNLDEAVQVAHRCLFMNGGQVCVSPTRAFVHEKIYDQFVAKSRDLALARVIGPPLDTKTEHGPLVNELQFKRVLEMIEVGKKEGAKLECGGKRHGTKGYYIQPTVFSNVTDDMRIAREEIFGPVQQLMKFSTLEEVIERSNDTEYGLAAGIFTKDLETALTYTHSVDAGTVWVNHYMLFSPQAPFGGYKMSGVGREMGLDGLKEYCEIKTISIKHPGRNS